MQDYRDLGYLLTGIFGLGPNGVFTAPPTTLPAYYTWTLPARPRRGQTVTVYQRDGRRLILRRATPGLEHVDLNTPTLRVVGGWQCAQRDVHRRRTAGRWEARRRRKRQGK